MLSLSTARSSLEEMLDSLRREEETQTPRDLPPPLPPRPKPTSRARLPSAKRPLPTSKEEMEVEDGEKCNGHVAPGSVSDDAKGRPINKVDDFDPICFWLH